MTTLPGFLVRPANPPKLEISERRASQIANLKAMNRAPVEMPDAAKDVMRLRAQIAQLSDEDFTALVVTEIAVRNLAQINDVIHALVEARARMEG